MPRPDDDAELIRTFFDYGETRAEAAFWAWNQVTESVLKSPDDAWPLILELVARAPDDAALAYVAAGPLEDFLHRHAARFEEAIITATRRDAKFRRAITGVWGWTRVPERLRAELARLTAGQTPL